MFPTVMHRCGDPFEDDAPVSERLRPKSHSAIVDVTVCVTIVLAGIVLPIIVAVWIADRTWSFLISYFTEFSRTYYST